MSERPTYEELGQQVRELQRSKGKYRQTAERYRRLMENLNEVLYMLDLDARVTYVSPNIEKISGYSREEIIGRAFIDFVHPDDLTDRMESFQRVLMGEGITTEYRYLTNRSGETAWVMTKARPIFENNEVVGIQGILVDISERKRAEEVLRESEKKFRTLFDSSPQAIALTDIKTGRIIDVNDTFCRLTKYSKNELIGKTTTELGFYSQDDRNRFIHKLTKTGKVNGIEMDFKISDGSMLNSRMFAVPIKIDGKSSVLTSFFDMTEQNRLEKQLLQSQKMESVGRLAGGVAHDFNNMLSVIIGNAEVAMMDTDPDEPVHKILKEILNAGHRSADITRQLLAFARKQTISPEVLDLNETVEGMLKMLRRLIGEDIDLAWLPGKHLGLIKVDPSQINQILANLMVNARDAIGGMGKITVETDNVRLDENYSAHHAGFVPGDFVMLAVSDDGCGMDKETLNNVFEPFFTTKGVNEGTGLGLATVYGIVKQNDGFINVYSEPEKGTTVRIYVPRHEGESRQFAAHDVTKISTARGETVLIVEDEVHILELVKTILERLGYTVLEAATPGRAVALAEDHKGEIHLLMTDVVMPEMNGRDLADQLHGLYPDLKVLFMSGYTANAIAHCGVLDEGMNFIPKPFSVKDLSIKVREVLDEDKG
jgi:two-component system cell cycle sensor histidine kinase/response regulator CckA